MITKEEFNNAAQFIRKDLSSALPAMIEYKNYLQREILNIATQKEIDDVVNSHVNQGIIDKLTRLAKQEWELKGDAISLYCIAMSIATILKEYEWGLEYLKYDGLWRMATRIQNA